MRKNTLKFWTIVIITIIFMYAFSASYTSDSVDNISYIIALAVDKNEGQQNLQVTFEFIDASSFSSDSSSKSTGGIIDTVSATSINSAINLLNAYVGKEVNLSHCKVVVFSEELAKEGIISEVSELMNNIQIRPSTNIVICKGNAMEYLQNSNSELEKILTKYYDIFPNSSEYTGYTSNIMIGEFYNYLTTKECGNLAILGGLNPKIKKEEESSSTSGGSSEGSSSESSTNSSEPSSSNSSNSEDDLKNKPNSNISLSEVVAGSAPILGERGTENIGLAVFCNGAYIGDLTAIDTLCHTLISGEVNSFLLTINNTEIYKNYIDISFFENTSPKISVDTSGEYPLIKIDIKLIGRINGVKDGLNFSEESGAMDLDAISDAAETSLKGYITTYLNKTTKQFKCDIDYFYNRAKRNFLTIQEWKKYDWAFRYQNANFDVNVDARVYYSLLNSD